jgi:hypothetical protein
MRRPEVFLNAAGLHRPVSRFSVCLGADRCSTSRASLWPGTVIIRRAQDGFGGMHASRPPVLDR